MGSSKQNVTYYCLISNFTWCVFMQIALEKSSTRDEDCDNCNKIGRGLIKLELVSYIFSV
jgi:hypothetical protein